MRVLLCLLVCIVSMQLLHVFSKAAAAQRLMQGVHIAQCLPDCAWKATEDIDGLNDTEMKVCHEDSLLAFEPDQNDREALPNSFVKLAIEMSRQHSDSSVGLTDRTQRPLLRPPRTAA